MLLHQAARTLPLHCTLSRDFGTCAPPHHVKEVLLATLLCVSGPRVLLVQHRSVQVTLSYTMAGNLSKGCLEFCPKVSGVS